MTNAPSSHPSFSRLLDWLEGKLSAEEAAALAQTVEQDPRLCAQVRWLRDFLRLSRETVLAEPPETVRRAAMARFAAYAQSKRSPGLWRTLIATLTSDTWAQLAPAGARAVSLRTTPRQLVYHTELADVALSIHFQAVPATFDLAGQVFPLIEEETEFVVQLVQEGAERRLVLADDLGRFTLEGLPAGTYELVLSSDAGEIVVGPIELE